MKINRNNYELFFIDYLEGNLNSSQQYEVELFISENPDLKQELEDFDSIKVNPAKDNFEHKDFLKKSLEDINNSNFEEYCIAYHEGNLNIKQIQTFNAFLKKNPDKQKINNLYSKTILKKDQNISFLHKAELHKTLLECNNNNFEEYCIAYHEKQLSPEQTIDLHNFISGNKSKTKEFEIFGKLFVKYDEKIIFENKNTLKKSLLIKPAETKIFRYISIAVAASILLLIGINVNSLFNIQMNKIANVSVKLKPDTLKNSINLNSNESKTKVVESNNPSRLAYIKNNKKNENKFIYGKISSVGKINNNQNALILAQTSLQEVNLQPTLVKNVKFCFCEKENNNNKEPNKNYLTLKELAVVKISRLVLKDKYIPNKKPSYLDVAELGVHEINKLLKKNIQFEFKKTPTGKLKHIALNSAKFGFSKTKTVR